jgi:DNA-binding response OmpR family regulator/anti-sigma regulatory factor (Ser/Thr protein kinase)
LVNRILDLTKLEAGRLTIQSVPTDFTAWLRRVVAQFDSLAVERGITLVAPTCLPAELTLMLDADKVEQVLTNLLANALTHTPAGGTVGVRAALLGPAQVVEVTVYDTGPGIAPAEQVWVFERYYQSPQRQAQGGTGLGLALSRELAQLLGGTLTLRSEEGQGAAFTLRLPAPVLPAQSPSLIPIAVDEPAPRPAMLPDLESADLAAPFALAPGPRPRVLVVEDQADLREYLRTLLAPTCEVLLAEDGQAALALLAREAPVDLLTTDAMMPRLSGTELLAQLRADPAYAHIPALMLTARADEAHRLAALTVGVDDYLTKPFVPAELLARVGILLARQQVRRRFAALPAEPDPLPLSSGTRPLDAFSGHAPAASVRSLGPVFSAVVASEQLAQWQQTIAAALNDPTFGPAELAVVLCLSERTLYRRLGELAGLTPAAWLRELRLTHARQLLEAGSFNSVAEVAAAAGFGNVKSFSQRYAERFGQRPSEYRHQLV